jgi:hypothetical protein
MRIPGGIRGDAQECMKDSEIDADPLEILGSLIESFEGMRIPGGPAGTAQERTGTSQKDSERDADQLENTWYSHSKRLRDRRVTYCMQIVQMESRRMMLSFVPKLDLSQLATTGNPFRKYIHRCFVQIDPATNSVADIMRTASAKLGAHLQLRAAYRREPITPFQIVSVWAFNDEHVGVAVPLTADDYLLSDEVIAHTRESGPPGQGAAFTSVLPAEFFIRMSRSAELYFEVQLNSVKQHELPVKEHL